jgi:hypothetical protein
VKSSIFGSLSTTLAALCCACALVWGWIRSIRLVVDIVRYSLVYAGIVAMLEAAIGSPRRSPTGDEMKRQGSEEL